MLTRSELQEINTITEDAMRRGIITKHHRHKLYTALLLMKQANPEKNLEKLTESDILRLCR